VPNPSLKIHGARFILTLDPQRRIIQDGSIIIEGQRIVQVGKAQELAQVPAQRVIDATEMVVTPGFVNGHLHVSYAHATRGIFPDDLGPAYLPNVFRLQGAMTAEEEYYTSLLAITELLKYGTTCFLDPGTTKHLDACRQAYQESGCRIIVGRQVVDQPNPINLPVSTTQQAVTEFCWPLCLKLNECGPVSDNETSNSLAGAQKVQFGFCVTSRRISASSVLRST